MDRPLFALAELEMSVRFALCALVCLGLTLATSSVATASTIVPMSDANLALGARAVVEATIIARDARWSERDQAVYTYVTIDVESVHAGGVPLGLVVLKQFGGVTVTRATVVFGAPELEPGTRALLFLSTDADGALRVAQLRLGWFAAIGETGDGEPLYARPAPAADAFGKVMNDATVTRGALLAAVRTAASSIHAKTETAIRIVPEEYLGAPPTNEFNTVRPGFRWFEPDSSQRVNIHVKLNGPSPSKGLDEAKGAFAAWSGVPDVPLRIVYAGPTKSGGLRQDGVSSISFADPRNQIDDLVGCQGVFAMASVSGDPAQTKTIGGRSFARILEADLTVNNGVECVVANNTPLLAEVLTHEFGHDLGLAHSSDSNAETDRTLSDATMFWVLHNDGRGASLRADDIAGIQFLYGKSSVPRPLSFESDALPDAPVGEPYSYSLAAKGGAAPYAWEIANGSLPPGFSLSRDGQITGSSGSARSVTVGIRLRDGANAIQQRTLRFRVSATPAPFLERATYSVEKRRLTLTGRYIDASASVSVNNRTLPATTKTKYRAAKMQLVVKGKADALNIDTSGTNRIVVTVRGQSSNTATY